MSLRVVKSARRVLDILEFFSAIRRPATVSEIERALKLPQSSTSVLLRSLVTLGYLEYLADERRFRPTLRVTKLGDWIEHGLSGALTSELEALRSELQETIILGRRQGAQAEFIYLLVPDRAIQFYARRNSLQPMTLSVVGRALLSQLPLATARGIIRRNNADALKPSQVVDQVEILEALEASRTTGLTETDPAFGGERDFHVIAKLLPVATGREPLAIGVAGPRERMLRNREIVIHALDTWLSHASEKAAELDVS